MLVSPKATLLTRTRSDKASELENLFQDIAHYIRDLQHNTSQESVKTQEEPQSKKRKLEHRPLDSAAWDKGTQYSVADVSFSIPQRKKLALGLSQSAGIRATSSTGGTSAVEFAVNWEAVRDVFCLPVPDKAQAQYNFCVFSANSDGSIGDQILWTVPDAAPKDGIIIGVTAGQSGDTYRTILLPVINKALKRYKKHVVEPNKDDFASQIVQAHRKGETAFHVKAFRGSKDGYLFLLSTGILWGFKKPLEFFAFDTIESVSYTSVLQRTFNLNISFRPSNDTSIQEFEFSMIDQVDFGGIDTYVKYHGLEDASMADQRRAKKLNVNGVKGKEAAAGDGEQEGGELEKARREAEDLEDEEEEDDNFDPGSEGESEGSGSSDDEDDDENSGEQAGDEGDEELGSEAESPVD